MNILKYFLLLVCSSAIIISCTDSDVIMPKNDTGSNSGTKIYYNKYVSGNPQDLNPSNFDIMVYDIATKTKSTFLSKAFLMNKKVNDFMAVYTLNGYWNMNVSGKMINKLFTESDAPAKVIFLKNGNILTCAEGKSDDNGNFWRVYLGSAGDYPGKVLTEKMMPESIPVLVNNESKLAFIVNGEDSNDSLFTVDLTYPYNVQFICNGIKEFGDFFASHTGAPNMDYVVGITSPEESSQTEQLVLINIDSKKKSILTNDQYEKAFPVFSPDGSKVAYSTYSQSGIIEVRVMDYDGRNNYSAIEMNAGDYYFGYIYWADNKHIVFNQVNKIDNAIDLFKLWLVDVTTKEKTIIDSDALVSFW